MKLQRFSRGCLRKCAFLGVLGFCSLALVDVAQAQHKVSVGHRYWSTHQVGHWNASPYVVGTGVFVNGRQLSAYEVAQLQQIFGHVIPGSYWMLSDGTYGLMGRPPMGNLYVAIQARSRQMYAPTRSPYLGARDTLYVPGTGVLLPDGTSHTW